ncbi:MAG: glycosyltransferase family 2 protein, partial [Pseudomonadota bacterium]
FLKTVGTNCAFRRAALMEVGGFDTAYRFFLDEADLNLRLSEAGWHAAINPAAEVLHGFAEGPHRTARRVPTTLHEIGASAAYFLHRHAPPKLHAGRISAFRAEQWARVLRHHGMGLLSGTQVRYLMTSFDAGIAEGPTRQGRTIASENWSTEHFIPKPSRAPAGRIVLSAPLFGGAGTRRAAEVAARDGYEVTLLTPEVSARPLTVQFMPEGYFLHRFGLAGKSERQNPLRLQSVAHRIKNERLRIEPQRLLETPATFIS